METKRNLKYFTSKGISPITLIGLALMVVGLVLCFSHSTRLFGVLGLVAGLGVMIFAGGGKASGDDIE